ncbi:MAG: hypothetical protein ACKOAR_04530, partial [Bacteroidota bacterium]
MKEGFYEKIVTEALAKALSEEPDNIHLLEAFSKNDGAVLIQRFVQDILLRAFSQINEERDELARQNLITFTNELVSLTARWLNDHDVEQERITDKGEVLKAFFRASTYTQADLRDHIREIFPITGLSESALFNGSKHTPSLESELKKEM